MERSQQALIVVDVQNDFVSGALAIAGAETIIEPINRLLAHAPVAVLSLDWHPPDHVSFASAHPGASPGDEIETVYGTQRVYADHCVQGSWGAEPDSHLHVDRAQLILRKGFVAGLDAFSAFVANDGRTPSGLSGYLRSRGVERIFVAGLARFGCVLRTAVDAAADGYEVFLVDDASKGNARMSDDEGNRILDSNRITVIPSQQVLQMF
ncbi:MAG: isochorismatase family protein [Burkholderiaceae bacterium]